jgi:hypothetical protein
LTGKAPDKFESISLLRGVSYEPALLPFAAFPAYRGRLASQLAS